MSDISEASSLSSDNSMAELIDELPGIPLNPEPGILRANDSECHRLKLLSAVQLIREHQSSIEFAYLLSCINEYMRGVLERKETKLKKKALNETLLTDVTSVLDYKLQAIQNQYETHLNLSRLQPNLTNNSHAPYYGNGSIVPRDNFLDTTTQSSVIGISRNDVLSFPAKPVGKPRMFSRLEDTFGSVRCNGESYIQNNSVFDSQPGPSNTSGRQFSFLKSRNNLNSFQINNSVHNGVNETNGFLKPYDTIDDKFSCIRVVSAKALVNNKVPVTLPTVNEAEEEKEEEHHETDTKKEPHLNNEFSLKNWTVILKNMSLCLKGTKLFGNEIVAETHVSEKILFRLRDGKIKTNNALYKLEGAFVINDEMPLKVKSYFSKNKFPLIWRKVLKIWIAELKDQNDPIIKNKIKSCQVVLEENAVAKQLKHLDQNKIKAQNKNEEKKVAKKEPSRKKKNNERSSSTDGGSPSKIKKTKNLKPSSESEASSKEISEPKSKVKSQAKNKKAKRKENSETKLKQSAKGNSQTQERDEINDFVNEFRNGDQELFGESIKTPSTKDKNICTPGALLNSIKKNPKLVGRYTPPLKVVNDYVEKNKNKTVCDTSIASGSKENPVAKRMAKSKDVKKVIRKQKKISSPKDDKLDHLLASLMNRTPQTTPKAIKEVFRTTENESDATDFGSDISSISS
ncbi:hypothetical protein O3M35_013345 [Rhynocoris fuscipes]|uniref:SANTA domain-containing protein n=2 Tax=Rhynocoris fuscipes TaxID=488301 RepID=A0AAW1CGH6_9HEMI